MVHNKPHSEETKKKMRKPHKTYNYVWSDKKRKNQSERMKGNKRGVGNKGNRKKGKESSGWRGGKTALQFLIRSSIEYKNRRSKIFERDKWICQTCNQRGGHLEAHHIKRFSLMIKENNIKNFKESLKCKELWNIDNGITLCKECHNLTRGRKK